MSHFVCPLCGKQCSILHYDPTDFVDDILIIQKRGLGKGKGFEEVSRHSIFDGDYPKLLDLISDRVAVLYDLLYEDVEDDEAEDEEEVDLEDEDESLSELEKELRIGEMEEDEEDINDLDEEIIE